MFVSAALRLLFRVLYMCVRVKLNWIGLLDLLEVCNGILLSCCAAIGYGYMYMYMYM